jgi:putative ABC transport system ATP-binding protein
MMILRFENVTHIYQTVQPRKVLDIPHLTIHQGDQILLRGVSGSGKTTLFNVASGLLKPTSGQIYYDTVDLYRMSEAKRDQYRAQQIGYIFQTHHLLNALTAVENVVMPMAFAKQTASQTWRKRALELLAMVNLADHADHRPAQLSAGQRMRVAIARALANQPTILFADEPTASLDQDTGQIVMDIIQSTCQKMNATLIVASHDPALTPRFGQLADLKAGNIAIQQVEQLEGAR